ncbi:MAG: YggT family protein [Candidatus Saccharimonadales bacterium]
MAYEDNKAVEATEVQTTTTQQVAPVRPTNDPVAAAEKEHRMTVIERVVWLVFGIIMGLLALRFLLRLLGANPSNAFADFIYTLSEPFAAPFYDLFNYDANLAQGRFEFETLIAILVYALIAWLIVKIITIGKR